MGRGSPEDWQPGDLAECIHKGPWYSGGVVAHFDGPTFGEVRVVKQVRFIGQALLVFNMWSPKGFSAAAFRKVRPNAESQFRKDVVIVGLDVPEPQPEREREVARAALERHPGGERAPEDA